MTRRRLETFLWCAVLALAATGWMRWRRAVPAPGPDKSAHVAAPLVLRRSSPPPAPLIAEVARRNPFRLERSPAPLAGAGSPGMTPPGGGASYSAFPRSFPSLGPIAGTRPPLTVTGIVGPPWEALLEGVPGRQGAVVARAGERFGDLRIRSITAAEVVVQGPDTTWRLQIKRSWQ